MFGAHHFPRGHFRIRRTGVGSGFGGAAKREANRLTGYDGHYCHVGRKSTYLSTPSELGRRKP